MSQDHINIHAIRISRIPQRTNTYYFILFVDNRKKLIRSYYWKRPSMYKCVEMFCTRNKKVARNLAKYVYLSFNAAG